MGAAYPGWRHGISHQYMQQYTGEQCRVFGAFSFRVYAKRTLGSATLTYPDGYLAARGTATGYGAPSQGLRGLPRLRSTLLQGIQLSLSAVTRARLTLRHGMTVSLRRCPWVSAMTVQADGMPVSRVREVFRQGQHICLE